MPVDTEVVKQALDNFENDEYVKAKELLRAQLRKAKNDYLAKELGLEQAFDNEDDEEENIDLDTLEDEVEDEEE
jgi:hypothetical protein